MRPTDHGRSHRMTLTSAIPTASHVSRSSDGMKHNALRARSSAGSSTTGSALAGAGLSARLFRCFGREMVEKPLRSWRRAAGRPAQPRIATTPHEGRGGDDIAPSAPEIDSRAKAIASGHDQGMVLQDDMPAAASCSLYGRFRPSLAFAAKMALCFEAAFQRIEVDRANSAPGPVRRPMFENGSSLAHAATASTSLVASVSPWLSLQRLLDCQAQAGRPRSLARIAKRELSKMRSAVVTPCNPLSSGRYNRFSSDKSVCCERVTPVTCVTSHFGNVQKEAPLSLVEGAHCAPPAFSHSENSLGVSMGRLAAFSPIRY